MNTFVPVTGDEVMNFAQKIATTLVGYSQQAQELDRLKAETAGLKADLSELNDDNAKLRADIQTATDLASAAERERDTAKVTATNWEAQAKALQDAMIGRDATVSELRQKLNAVEDEWYKLTQENDKLQATVKELAESRTYWENVANQRGRELSVTRDRLHQVEASLQTIQEAHAKVFAAFAPATTLTTGPEPLKAEKPEPHWAPNPGTSNPIEDWSPPAPTMPSVKDETGQPMPSTATEQPKPSEPALAKASDDTPY